MKQIKVELTGTNPILMNSPKAMLDEAEGITVKTAKRNIKEEAEKLAYRMKSKELYVPAEAIKGTIINASAYKKFGKYSARPIIAGGITISPTEIGLGTKTYDLDIRTVVIQRARIVKARPKIEKWKINFIINFDETLIPNAKDIFSILEDAGKRVGILDFRPAKNGSFGTFVISKWEVEK